MFVQIAAFELRLRKDQVLAQEYADTFSKQAESGTIERVPPHEEARGNIFFLPHHGIVRVDKETTKLCIVFDVKVFMAREP